MARQNGSAKAHEQLVESERGRTGHPQSVRFTLADSAPSSRSASPVSSDDGEYYNNEKMDDRLGFYAKESEGGMDVYEATLSWWRAGFRKWLVSQVKRESEVIAKMQAKIRSPWLDAYFVYASSLGTHTFFMIVLPAFFFFGYGEMGRGLLVVLGLGVYFTSVLKDLFCSPRPFAPPVTRLTIGTHHLEYGFPSTHSTNSVSIALYLFAHIYTLSTTFVPSSTPDIPPSPIISSLQFNVCSTILAIYAFTIVFGRLYTAMHSFVDCIAGVSAGSAIWWVYSNFGGIPITLSQSNPLFWVATVLSLGSVGPTDPMTRIVYLGRGLGTGAWVEKWVQSGGWEVPLLFIPIGLLAVNQHPQPVDDCPCFEDAIAFGSVVLGAMVGRWAMSYAGVALGMGKTVVMPGSGWVLDEALGRWVKVERDFTDVTVWWSYAALKMVVGIMVIFIWRLVAKSALHIILPPIFRLLSRVFRLPNRRFYTPATDYKSVPSEFGAAGRSGDGSGFALRPIPSVIDLPGTGWVGEEVGGIGSGSGVAVGGGEVKLRGNGSSGEKAVGNGRVGPAVVSAYAPPLPSPLQVEVRQEEGGMLKDGQPVKHYDADVLTKVIVYAGIAVLACEVLPVMFDVVGWGVRSWV